MAPEVGIQQHLEGPYDLIVDSWSLGVVVFNMLTGYMPFPERKEPSAYASDPQSTITPVVNWELLSGVSDDATLFISHLIEFDPKRRMSAADALKDPWLAAHAAQASVPERAGSPSSTRTASTVSGTAAPMSRVASGAGSSTR